MTPEPAKHLRVSPLRRAFCIPLATLTAAAGIGPFVDSGSFRSAVFDTFRDLAPLPWWGLVWLVTTAFVVVASTTGKWWSYVVAHTLVAFMSMFWLLVLVKSRALDGNAVSLTAFGLWAFPAGYSLIALFVPIASAPARSALYTRH